MAANCREKRRGTSVASVGDTRASPGLRGLWALLSASGAGQGVAPPKCQGLSALSLRTMKPRCCRGICQHHQPLPAPVLFLASGVQAGALPAPL